MLNLNNNNINDDKKSHGSQFTKNSDGETIYLVSFYKSVDFNNNYFDDKLNLRMGESKPFICCSTLSFDKNGKQLADIYPGNDGEMPPCFGYIINQKTAQIICNCLQDSWTNKDTFNPNVLDEYRNFNNILDIDLIIQKKKEEARQKGQPLTEQQVVQLKKDYNEGRYIECVRKCGGEEHRVLIRYNAIVTSTKKCLKETRKQQKKGGLTGYTEDTTSSNRGLCLGTCGMMIDVDRLDAQFGIKLGDFYVNSDYRKNIENVITFLMKKKCKSIGIIQNRNLLNMDLKKFFDLFVMDQDMKDKYCVNQNGCIISKSSQNNINLYNNNLRAPNNQEADNGQVELCCCEIF